ncbi:branched-chain amino acid ABC transporter ATP-binding protein/permease [Mycetohabitans sp. B5]|uniref:Amino acid/amide ABC transporter membrane protein 2 (HAAT family) /amino acid/amide ABC transporter ATP-binding protein 1 (HAAT family) n=1 Tax=Mycetohabitans endofungorum TaxID=417203 RepID=A0A2P5KEV7_9BURK|nr:MULTISPECIES: branched-chain amino acid ABC transporter ATP-binding protein/permease [Mycetohabitans]MCG1054061.1 branched-chain amino acid ABC transporter ATP-binding protein/permease [Mycetohabitans sp. B5]PPB85230.1 amino acid/amide ABC transporter membrane protein 2 (HAAT family) /amino acid/amide ABC transporter ATP-binding protein 1 (HAAT family) [Mycetohabitans endofungorum]
MMVHRETPRGVWTDRNVRRPPWGGLILATVLTALPLLPLAHGEPSGAALALASQAAVLIVFALSYDLLLGQTGLLSFGHAMYYGIGALAAARAANAWALSAPWLPVVGGAGAALVAVPAGWLSVRRGGVTFAMVTLGLGELVATAASTVPEWFGGVGGVMIDRGAVPGWLDIDFGSTRTAYGLVVAVALASCMLIAWLLRTPLVRVANAVRDNPRRAAFVGVDPSRVRWAMTVIAAFFAGVAGALSVVTFEIATADNASVATCATALIAVVIGGTGTFAGPVLGAVVYVSIANGLASITRAWPMYVGLFFLFVVVLAPGGLVGAWLHRRMSPSLADSRRARCALPWFSGRRIGYALAVLGMLAGSIAVIQSVYAWRFDDTGADIISPRWHAVNGWGIAVAGVVLMAVSSFALRATVPRSSRRVAAGLRSTSASAAAMASAHASLAPMASTHASAAATGPAVSEVTAPVIVAGAAVSAQGQAAGTAKQAKPVYPVPAIRPGHVPSSPALDVTLDDVHVSYRATPVLRGVRLHVRAGEIHALIGPNGAGKSTVFNVLSGVTQVDRGTVLLEDRAIRRLAAHRIARLGVARGLQTPSLFAQLSVLDNVCCAMLCPRGAPLYRWLQPAAWRGLRKRALDWLQVVGMGDEASARAAQLSYARQRALELAMATASGARLLLLDEPTAGMSRAEAIEALALIRRMAAGRTVLLIEHDMDIVFDLADRISVLVDGVVIATGTPAQIRANPGVREAYLGPARAL